jgi:hypothetical protein
MFPALDPRAHLFVGNNMAGIQRRKTVTNLFFEPLVISKEITQCLLYQFALIALCTQCQLIELGVSFGRYVHWHKQSLPRRHL